MQETIKKIKNGDLVTLLSLCNNEELDPIVNILMAQKTCSLDNEYNYKKFTPDHTKYYKLIADEISLFGGNTIVNLARKSNGVSYDEIVFDVCERLGIPHTKSETTSNEEALLKIYELEAEKVNKNKFDIKGEALKAILPRLVAGPLGWLSIPAQVAGPAYRVTVPCVIEIAQLRKKKIDAYNSTVNKNTTPAKATAEVAKSNVINIQNEHGDVALSLMQLPDMLDTQTWNNMSGHDQGISKLNPLLQAVPALATAYDVNTTKYMEVLINGPLTKATSFLEDGAFRAITRDGNGNIVENAKLFDPANLSKVVNAGALFQIASIAVAQKHLADINQKLTDIKVAVENIAEFQQKKRKSKILGSIAYFEQVASSVIDGEQSQAILHQIEAKESELLAIQDHLISDICDFNSGLEIQDNDMFGTESVVEEIKLKQKTVEGYYNQLLLCIRARACGWQLLSLYPNNNNLVKNRKETLKNELQKLDGNGALLKETEKVIIGKIKEISSTFNTDTTLNERKLFLLDLNQSIFSGIATEKIKIEKEVEHAESFARELKQPVASIFVKVENEKIVATSIL